MPKIKPKIFSKLKNLFQTKKSVFLVFVLFLVFLGISAPTKHANAAVWDFLVGIAEDTLVLLANFIIGGALQVLAAIGNVLLGIASAILTWVTSPNFIDLSYTNPADNFILKAGWTITRDLTNIGFVVVLIIIGLATALRIKDYQWQKLLPKLIVIILLINFTPVIAGVVVDASNVLMNNLLRDPANLNKTISFDNFSAKWETWAGNLKGNEENVFKNITSTRGLDFLGTSIALVVYTFLTAAILFVFSALFVVRYIAIWVLVILSPLAFFAWILPSTKKFFSQWWQQFLHWSFIGATTAFFLYLSHRILSQITELKIVERPKTFAAEGVISGVLPYFVIVVFMYIGFFVSLKSSAMGANTIIGWAKRREKGIVGWTGRKARVGAQVAIKSERFKKIADRIATAPTVFGKLIRPVGRAMQRLPEEQNKVFDKAESDAKKMDAARVATRITKGVIPGLRAPGEVAGLLSGAAEDLDKAKDIVEKYNISPKEIIKAIKWTRGQGRIDKAKKIFGANAEALKETGVRPEDLGLKFDLNKEKDREEAKEFGMTKEDALKAGLSQETAREYAEKYDKHRGYLGKMLAEARTVDEIKSFKKLLTSKSKDDEWVQNVVHKFWDGTQLHRAGEEIGAAFIEIFQDNAKDEFEYIRENPKMHKYLSSTPAQAAGYSFGSSKIDRIKKLAEDNEKGFKLEMALIRSEVEQAKGKKRQDLISELSMYERVLATKKAKEWKEKEEAEIGAPEEEKKKKPKMEKPKGVKIPLMITKKMKARLRGMGYTDDQIKKMTPEEAWKKLGGIP